MARCKKRRCCRELDGDRIFKPLFQPLSEVEIIEIDLDNLKP